MARTGAASSLTTMAEINWDDEEHRRYIAARLVQQTYHLESDQTKGRLNGQEVSERRESFHCFSLLETMLDCCFIYGAIFEYVAPEGACRHPSAPRYIVAFRGTMLCDPTTVQDLYLDLNVVLNRQHDCHRFSHARERVWKLLDDAADIVGDIWLTGHSLGASIALDVGRDMAMGGCYLPTFLFNPPQVSLAPAADMLRMTKQAKWDLYATSYCVKDALGKTVLRRQKEQMEVLFEQLSPWAPEIYVHQRDLICNGIIDYFDLRQQLQKRFPSVVRSAATLAYRDMVHLCSVVGFRETKERPHLLPSVRLWINSSSDGNPHELRQWCQTKLKLSSKLYSWP